MRYFTKYMPQEGEIKNGDITSWPEGDDCPHSGKFTEVTPSCITHLSALSCKPHKLFLCSRDIQAGDTIWNEAINGFATIGQEYIDNLDDLSRSISCKVIGEISPDALSYAKEGQEFEAEQVDIRKICHDTSIPPYSKGCLHCGAYSGCDNDEGNIVKIKGPCGYFH